MDVIGLGTEIIECLRVGRMIEQHGEAFLLRVYTAREIRFCQQRRRATEHFAARWAAKEAVLRALQRPWREGIEWTDVEIDEKPGQAPEVQLRGSTAEVAEAMGVVRVMLSMARCRAYATATAVAFKV
jgi:holo-[acyl-carrier protein] synthase